MAPPPHPIRSSCFSLLLRSRCIFMMMLVFAVVVEQQLISARAHGSSTSDSSPRPAHDHDHEQTTSEKGARAGFLTSYALPPKIGICEASVTIHGYKCEEFTVKTEDGYILSMQRISEGRPGTVGGHAGINNKNKPPVLLQHGLFVDGQTWVLNAPDQSLGLILADAGFDVYLANFRGTRFSRHHTTLNSTYAAYWNWTWDELAAYDLPANLDFVYRHSGNQKIHYVGHSMGTLIAFASLSQGNKLVIDKFRTATFLSPVAYISHMTTVLGTLAAKAFLGEVTTVLGVAEFNPKGEPVKNFLRLLCANPMVNCFDLISAFTGMNCCLNETTINLLVKNEPQPTSTKNLVHLSQSFRDDNLAKYNYGKAELNKKYYGEENPPVYDLTKIPKDIPMYISYGGKDELADTRDVARLLDNLKAAHDKDRRLKVQMVKNYAHVDFIMGINAKAVLYNNLIHFFKTH